jgi:hypothetical protein
MQAILMVKQGVPLPTFSRNLSQTHSLRAAFPEARGDRKKQGCCLAIYLRSILLFFTTELFTVIIYIFGHSIPI